MICLAIVLMVPVAMFGGNDIMEKQLLQYKYVIFFQQISLDMKRENKVYYVANKADIQETVSWLEKYYPDRNALDMHMRAIMVHVWIVFTDKLPTNNKDLFHGERNLCFDVYINFDIDGKTYFTEEQLALLYKLFEEKGVPLKLDSGPIAEPRTKKMIIPEPSINSR